MSNTDVLNNILATVRYLQGKILDPDIEKAQAAKEAYQELLDGFYEEYQGMLAPQQYKAAKDNPAYFLRLIELAYYHEEQEIIDRKMNS
jgi:hypothetical protein